MRLGCFSTSSIYRVLWEDLEDPKPLSVGKYTIHFIPRASAKRVK